jgi:predicted RecA/RadA family phage recombinase
MPRPAVKSLSAVVDKWTRRAGSAGEEYKQGVIGTPKSWSAATVAAAPAYKQGVTEAAAAGRFEKGVAAAGDAKWKDRASVLGPMRFSQGVQESGTAYSTGVGPVLAAIGAVDLPARGPVGSEGNYMRSAAIGKALRQLRVGRR